MTDQEPEPRTDETEADPHKDARAFMANAALGAASAVIAGNASPTAIMIGALVGGGASIVERARAIYDAPNATARRDFRGAVQDIVFEVQRRVDNLEEGLGNVLEARARQRLEENEERRLLGNFALEATLEPSASRYELVIAAGASAMVSQLSVEERARVERTLRELGPRDLLELDRIASMVGAPDSRSVGTALLRFDAWVGSPSRDELAASGCVYEDGENSLRVTRRGDLVLELCAPWIDQKIVAGDHKRPQADLTDDERTERDAFALLRVRLRQLGTRPPYSMRFEWPGADDGPGRAALRILLERGFAGQGEGRTYELKPLAVRERERLLSER